MKFYIRHSAFPNWFFKEFDSKNGGASIEVRWTTEKREAKRIDGAEWDAITKAHGEGYVKLRSLGRLIAA